MLPFGHFWIEYKIFNNDFSLPWNQQTFFGWALEQSACLLATTVYFLITSALLSLFIAICEFHEAFYKYLQHLVTSIDQQLGDLQPKMIKLRSKQILCETIRFHVSAKEWEFPKFAILSFSNKMISKYSLVTFSVYSWNRPAFIALSFSS